MNLRIETENNRTKIFMDGVQMPHVTSVTFSHSVGAIPSLKMEVVPGMSVPTLVRDSADPMMGQQEPASEREESGWPVDPMAQRIIQNFVNEGWFF